MFDFYFKKVSSNSSLRFRKIAIGLTVIIVYMYMGDFSHLKSVLNADCIYICAPLETHLNVKWQLTHDWL